MSTGAGRAQLAELRERSRRGWLEVAGGWERQHDTMRAATAGVSQWMVQAIDPQPGHRVLELAAGIGETGFLAAELIAPGGRLICSDQSEAMLAGARRRAQNLGLADVEFRMLEAEWIDLALASVDGVLCRWGYMLMADPEAALRETRRVLAPGGRLALAAWTSAEENPWASIPARELVARGHVPAPEPGAPGMFALGDAQALRAGLQRAGFCDVQVDRLDFSFCYRDLAAWWAAALDLSPVLRPALDALASAEARSFRRAVEAALTAYTDESGQLELPARTLVAAAGA